jgi:hypothetical protein
MVSVSYRAWEPASAISIQHSIRNQSEYLGKKKKIKRHSNWKGRTKSLFEDDIILHIENLKDFCRQPQIRLLGLINEFNQVASFKVNT